MAETTQQTITSEWVKISDGPCSVQSVSDLDAFDKLYFDLFVSDTQQPNSSTKAFMRTTLAVENANFPLPSPVWLRLNAVNANEDQLITIIK